MNRCISGQASSSRYGSAPRTCAVCSLIRKNARMPSATAIPRLTDQGCPDAFRERLMASQQAEGMARQRIERALLVGVQRGIERLDCGADSLQRIESGGQAMRFVVQALQR